MGQGIGWQSVASAVIRTFYVLEVGGRNPDSGTAETFVTILSEFYVVEVLHINFLYKKGVVIFNFIKIDSANIFSLLNLKLEKEKRKIIC